MEQMKRNKLYLYFIGSFFVFNIINTYFLTVNELNRYIASFRHTVIGEVNALIGNLSILLLLVLIVYVIFRKEKNRMIALIMITGFLNLFIFALSIFTLYYGANMSKDALSIFKNPSDGIAHGMFNEILYELFNYWRIVVFIPLIVLVILYLIYQKKHKKIIIKHSFDMKRFLIGFISVNLLFITSIFTFLGQFKQSKLPVGSVMSTYATQNLGVYPFYVINLLGEDFNVTTRKNLGLQDDNELAQAYQKFNKNQESYQNLLDQKTYSNKLLYQDAQNLEANLNDTDLLNGYFKDKNLVLVHLESLNYFLFEVPEIRERFPFLNALFEESYVFSNFYTNVGMGVSSDAELSVLSGIYPNGYSAMYWDYEKTKYTLDSIPKKLNEQAYKTMPIHGDKGWFYNRDVVYQEDKLIGFNEPYYDFEMFLENKEIMVKDGMVSFEYQENMIHTSPWVSDFQLMDKVHEIGTLYQQQKEAFMLFPITMMPHTPYQFDPIKISRPAYDKWINNEDKSIKSSTLRYINYVDYVDQVIQRLFFDEHGTLRTLEDTVYVFYGDHGSGLKNDDLDIIFNKTIDPLEKRKMLQQTIAFIYAPGETLVSRGDYTFYEGTLKGEQTMVRSQIDLYRTIVELFDIGSKTDLYFGVNGLSKEPTYAIDNRVLDIVIDDLKGSEYIISMRNYEKRYPLDTKINEALLKELIYFKQLSDLLITTSSMYGQVKDAIYNMKR